MVTVKPVRRSLIESCELLHRGMENILKRTSQSGVIKHLRPAVPPKIGRCLPLVFQKLGGTVGSGKWCREVKMQTDIKAVFACDTRSSLRILHKDHSAYRRDSSAQGAIVYSVGAILVASPIVRVNDEPSGQRCFAFPRKRFMGEGCAFHSTHLRQIYLGSHEASDVRGNRERSE